MVNLLEQIRAALDELTLRLEGRVVDVEMPRLFVAADPEPLSRALVALFERALDMYQGDVTVRTTKHGGAARVEISGEHRAVAPAAVDWPDSIARDVELIGGALDTDGPIGWLTVPLAGTAHAPE
jgi:hypothetical protein